MLVNVSKCKQRWEGHNWKQLILIMGSEGRKRIWAWGTKKIQEGGVGTCKWRQKNKKLPVGIPLEQWSCLARVKKIPRLHVYLSTVLSHHQAVLKGARALMWAWFSLTFHLLSVPNLLWPVLSRGFGSWGQTPVLQIMTARESGLYGPCNELLYTGGL